MINLIDLILIVDNVISDDESELLISEFETKKSFKESSRDIDSTKVLKTNADFIVLNPKTKTHKLVNDKTNIMIGHYKEYIENLGHFDTHGLISKLGFSHNYRIIKYGIDQSFHDHVDKGASVYGSCSLALNDDYEGGEYRFFRGGHKIKLKKGQGMIWPADYFFVHGVDKITKGCKYSMNSFLGDVLCVKNEASNQPPILELFGILLNEITEVNEIVEDYYHKSSEESMKMWGNWG